MTRQARRRGARAGLRVIAGTLKGRPIIAPPGREVRPPLTRIRKSVFDTLTPYLPEALVLDCFGGAGTFTFEAISRGVAGVTVIERDPGIAHCIADNARALGVPDRVELIREDTFQVLPRLAHHRRWYQIVFLAPPQYRRMVPPALEMVGRLGLVQPEGVVVVQMDPRERDDLHPDGLELWREKRDGHTLVQYWVPSGAEEGD